MHDKPPLACSQHDHGHCISGALSEARQICAKRGVRLTELRAQVLEFIWQSHKPLGAYTLMEMLAQASTRRVAPPTVYRALEFLLEQGLIHRINALNAFIGCPSPGQRHQNHFLICRHCGVTIEIASDQLSGYIVQCASDAGFRVDSQSLEVMGCCPSCRAGENESNEPSDHE